MSVWAWASNVLDSVDSSAQETIQQQLSKAKALKTPITDRRSANADLPPATPSTPTSAASALSNAPISSTQSSQDTPAAAAATITVTPSKADKPSRRKKGVVQQLPTTPIQSPSTPPTLSEPLSEPAPSHAADTDISNNETTTADSTSSSSSSSSSSTSLPADDSVVESNGSDSPSQPVESDAHSNDNNSSSTSSSADIIHADDATDIAPSHNHAAPADESASSIESADTIKEAAFDEAKIAPSVAAAAQPTAAPVVAPPAKPKKASAAASLLPSASAFFSSALASAKEATSSAPPSSSSSSSAQSATTSSSSSASSDAAAEIASLRAVWNETRDQLAKAKKLLTSQQDSHTKALQQLSHDWQTAMDAQQHEYEEKQNKLKEAMERQTTEFQQAITTRKEYTNELSAREAEYKESIEELQQRLAGMEEKQQQLMDEREQMMNAHSAALQSHQTLLARLRAEESERMVALEAEMKAKTSSLARRQDRDTSQEEEQIQYTQIAAQVQRELEDKTRQLDRVTAEKRWIEADQHSLNDQLTAMKARVDEQHKQLQTLQTSSRERSQAQTAELNTLKQQLTTQQQTIDTLTQQNTTLQQQLNETTQPSTQSTHSTHSSTPSPANEWEDRVRAMTEHLMSKSTQIDRLAAERTALSVQLDDARSRLVAYEKAAKRERDKSLEDMEAGGAGSSVRGVGSNGEMLTSKGKSVAGRGVVHAVSALDRLGGMTGQMLRRHAWVRVSFAAYVFVIHVWVLFILFHLIGEMEPSAAGSGAVSAVTDVSNVAAAANTLVRSRGRQLGNG